MSLKSIYNPLDNEEISEAKTSNDNIDIALNINKFIWFEDAGVLLNAKHHSTAGVQLPNLLGNNLFPQSYTKAYISPSVRNTDVERHSYVITKARYKFGNLQIYKLIKYVIQITLYIKIIYAGFLLHIYQNISYSVLSLTWVTPS